MKQYIFASLFSVSCCCATQEHLDLIVSKEAIATKIEETARQINRDYREKRLTILMVMKGSVCVTADLIRRLEIPFELDYVKASSYNGGTVSGNLAISDWNRLDLEGKDVLLVDDIFDTGKTITTLCEALKEKRPASIKTLVLLVKNVPRSTTYRPDYVLFDIENRFVIGYGLDYKEFYRGLPEVFAFPDNKPPF